MVPHIFRYEISPHVWVYLECNGILHSKRSRFQKIEVVDSLDFGKMLVLDGVINVSERDEFVYHEMLAHVPLFSHPEPHHVLIVGGGDGGTAREVLKHEGISRIQLVEIDEEVMSVSRDYFPALAQSLDHPKVHVLVKDAVEYLKETKEKFDIILIDSTDPVIEQSGGLFTVPFYRDCLNALTDKGIMAAQVGDVFFESNLVTSVLRNLKEAFHIAKLFSAPIPSYTIFPYCFAFCSNRIKPQGGLGLSRFDGSFETKYYNPQIHQAAFALPEYLRRDFEG
ncbi:MAG: polyamine aminopropyltransferase [Deltaproteobacteria bacterium]|nr:MAG: polyamine aminopropyltransferase [Deltaproteobacteria bacterium]